MDGGEVMADDEVKEFKPKSGSREHAITLAVYTNGRECLSWIPNPRSYADEGGPVWVMTWGDPLSHRHEIAGLIETLNYLLSPHYTAADVMKRLRELRAAYRDALTGDERTSVVTEQDRVEP